MKFLEIFLAALAAFMIGFAWYTALFGKIWQQETGVTDEQAQSGLGVTHGTAFVLMLCIACGINIIIGFHAIEEQTFTHGAFHGLMNAVFYAVPIIGIHYAYQKKSLKLFLIDAGYALVFFSAIGAVLGGLHLG